MLKVHATVHGQWPHPARSPQHHLQMHAGRHAGYVPISPQRKPAIDTTVLATCVHVCMGGAGPLSSPMMDAHLSQSYR
eukprot:366417-Chlamydomonas_euryale.AAC.28